jgi:anti-sigma regulatory factor (Ser/Thr protein kinase)
VSAPGARGSGFLSRGDWVARPVLYERVEIVGGLTAPTRARAVARRVLAGLLPDPAREDLLVLVTELVTNAVRHAGVDESRNVVLHLAAAPRIARVEVCDGGPGFDPVERSPGPGGGFGLMLLRTLPDRWGLETDDGVCAWFEFDLA